ncbi:MAG: serine/threonine-protein kinase [Leptolyngbyaceae cyanobacterium]
MASTASLKNTPPSQYRLLGLVGQGQFGQVYCGLHRKTGQLVALKNVSRNRLPTRRFLRELRFLLSLSHPHIVNCYAIEQSDTGRKLVLDYCEAGTLRSLLEQETQLTLAEILTLITEVLTALNHAHNRHIVHCDIKPENILLSLTADSWQAKVSDFGIARLSQELKGAYTGATGSPAYMAPERFYHQYAEASDLYAVGVMLYELLLGDRPFTGNHQQLMIAHLNYPITLPSTLPQGLQLLLSKSLEKLMARRFRSATAMQAAVCALQQTLTVEELQQRFPKPIFADALGLFQPRPHAAIALPANCSAHCSALGILAGTNETPSLLLAAIEHTVYGWSLTAAGIWQTPSPSQTWHFDAAVQQLVNGQESAIAVTDTTLYRLPSGDYPAPLATFASPICPVAGTHRWLIVQDTFTRDQFWLVDRKGQVPRTPRLLKIPPLHGIWHSLSLSDRHWLIADVTQQTTQLHILTRWGTSLARLSLQTPLHHLAPSQTPHQFLACGGTHQQDLLVIQLKPFRVMRCRLDIVPTWLGELVVGYAGISTNGQLRIVNFQGHSIGQVDNLPIPMAVAFSPPHHIWLATNQDDAPRLHCIDIRDLALDIVF